MGASPRPQHSLQRHPRPRITDTLQKNPKWMGTQVRKTFASAAAVLLSATVVGLSPSTASAAPYNGVCGDGYTVLDSRDISGATVYVTYNASNGHNCVTTIRNNPGTAHPMGAGIRLGSDGPQITDEGSFTTYAGPVYMHAPGQCVDWAGYNVSTNNDVTVRNCS